MYTIGGNCYEAVSVALCVDRPSLSLEGSIPVSRTIEIVEVGPRDGLQNEPTLVSTQDKVALIERAIAAGIRRVEVTSFVNPKRVPQMADAEAVLQALMTNRHPDVRYVGLVLNQKGFERALAAGCNEVGMAVVASNTFNLRNQGVSTEESVEAWLQMARAARAAGIRAQVTVSAAFGCPFEGEVAVVSVCAATSTIPATRVWPMPMPPSKRASPRWMPASAAWVVARSPRRPPAISPPRTCSTCSAAWAYGLASISTRSSPPAAGCRTSSDDPCPAC